MPTKAEMEGWVPPGESTLPVQYGLNFNLMGVNIDDMVKNLNIALQDTSPRNFFDSWRKSRRIVLSTDRINSLVSYAEKVREANQIITQTQAELRVAPMIVESIIRGQFEKAQQEIAIQAREHFDRMQEIDDRAEARRLQLSMLFLQVELIQSKIDEVKARALADVALANKIDNTNMSGAEIANIYASRGTQKAEISEELATLTQKIDMLNAEISIKRAESDIKVAEARKSHIQADMEQFVRDKTLSR